MLRGGGGGSNVSFGSYENYSPYPEYGYGSGDRVPLTGSHMPGVPARSPRRSIAHQPSISEVSDFDFGFHTEARRGSGGRLSNGYRGWG